MKLTVQGQTLYAYTGGKALRADQPTVVFIHGVLGDHSVWVLQSRFLAHHGWNVLAIDLPGHGLSAGEAPESVEQAAQGVLDLLDAAGVRRAALVGHSWGSLIALEAASRWPARVSHLALVNTASPMRVSPALLQSALERPLEALKMINVLSRATLAPPPSLLGPGTWVYGAGMALGQRVLASNAAVNVFHRGFLACDRYTRGEEAAASLHCPLLVVVGEQDQMTPPKAVAGLLEAARTAAQTHGHPVQVLRLPTGHQPMSEAPDALLAGLRQFLA